MYHIGAEPGQEQGLKTYGEQPGREQRLETNKFFQAVRKQSNWHKLPVILAAVCAQDEQFEIPHCRIDLVGPTFQGLRPSTSAASSLRCRSVRHSQDHLSVVHNPRT